MTDSNKTDDEDDKALFSKWVKDVRPLTKNQGKVLLSSQQKKPKPMQHQIENEPANPAWSDPHFEEQMLSANQHTLQHNASIQKQQLKKLKQGKIPIEARLDLHGYKIEQARIKLQQFIHHSQLQHMRCICIVHGKGTRNAQGEAKLKSMVHHWLSQEPEVLALVSAQPKDGGTGAIYVLLKKIPYADS